MALLRRFQRFIRELPFRDNPFKAHSQINCNHGRYAEGDRGELVPTTDAHGAEWEQCIWCAIKFPKSNVLAFRQPSPMPPGDAA